MQFSILSVRTARYLSFYVVIVSKREKIKENLIPSMTPQVLKDLLHVVLLLYCLTNQRLS